MENKTKTRTEYILITMHVLAWVIFIGSCIKTGAILYSFLVSLFINPMAAQNLHQGLDLSELLTFSSGNYSNAVSFIIFLSGIKAYILYLVIKIFLKINLVHPFSKEVSSLISRISHVAIGTGIVTLIARAYFKWLSKEVALSGLEDYLGGVAEFLLLGGIIFIIAQVFKRGIEIQSENELTV